MVQETARDRVWNVVVEDVFFNDVGVTRPYVSEQANVSEKTARETLKSMKFLSTRTTKGAGYKQYYLEDRTDLQPCDDVEGGV